MTSGNRRINQWRPRFSPWNLRRGRKLKSLVGWMWALTLSLLSASVGRAQDPVELWFPLNDGFGARYLGQSASQWLVPDSMDRRAGDDHRGNLGGSPELGVRCSGRSRLVDQILRGSDRQYRRPAILSAEERPVGRLEPSEKGPCVASGLWSESQARTGNPLANFLSPILCIRMAAQV